MTAICDLIVIFIDSPRYNNYRREVERVGGAEALSCFGKSWKWGESALDAPREMGFAADSCLRNALAENIGVSPENSLNSRFHSRNLKFE